MATLPFQTHQNSSYFSDKNNKPATMIQSLPYSRPHHNENPRNKTSKSKLDIHYQNRSTAYNERKKLQQTLKTYYEDYEKISRNLGLKESPNSFGLVVKEEDLIQSKNNIRKILFKWCDTYEFSNPFFEVTNYEFGMRSVFSETNETVIDDYHRRFHRISHNYGEDLYDDVDNNIEDNNVIHHPPNGEEGKQEKDSQNIIKEVVEDEDKKENKLKNKVNNNEDDVDDDENYGFDDVDDNKDNNRNEDEDENYVFNNSQEPSNKSNRNVSIQGNHQKNKEEESLINDNIQEEEFNNSKANNNNNNDNQSSKSKQKQEIDDIIEDEGLHNENNKNQMLWSEMIVNKENNIQSTTNKNLKKSPPQTSDVKSPVIERVFFKATTDKIIYDDYERKIFSKEKKILSPDPALSFNYTIFKNSERKVKLIQGCFRKFKVKKYLNYQSKYTKYLCSSFNKSKTILITLKTDDYSKANETIHSILVIVYSVEKMQTHYDTLTINELIKFGAIDKNAKVTLSNFKQYLQKINSVIVNDLYSKSKTQRTF